MTSTNNLTRIPIYHSSLLLYREFVNRNSVKLLNGEKLYNLVTESEKYVLDTLLLIQDVIATLETLKMSYNFICNGYEPLENITLESYNFDVYHLDVFNIKMVTLQELVYKLTSLVYKLSDWIRAINKTENKSGAKFNYQFIKKHRQEVQVKLNNSCLFSLLFDDFNTHLKSIQLCRNRSIHDGKVSDYTYDSVAVGMLFGIEKGNMQFDDMGALRYVAKTMVDAHQKLKDDMKIHLDNAFELVRIAFCSLSVKYLSVLYETLDENDKDVLSQLKDTKY